MSASFVRSTRMRGFLVRFGVAAVLCFVVLHRSHLVHAARAMETSTGATSHVYPSMTSGKICSSSSGDGGGDVGKDAAAELPACSRVMRRSLGFRWSSFRSPPSPATNERQSPFNYTLTPPPPPPAEVYE